MSPNAVVSATPETQTRGVLVDSEAGYGLLSDLELATLRYLSQGKDAQDISDRTGVSESVIADKAIILYARGYITQQHSLTERGMEALGKADEQRIRHASSP